MYNEKSLDIYAQIWQATDDRAANATSSVLNATTGAVPDTSRLGIPENSGEWEQVWPVPTTQRFKRSNTGAEKDRKV
jgi:hypothetical protein